MKQVYDNLFLGDSKDADNHSKHRENNVQYMLNVAEPTEESTPGNQLIKDKKMYFNIPLLNGDENPDVTVKTTLETAYDLYQKAVERDEGMLVYCSVSVSRSVAVAAALMSLENSKRVRENVGRIQKVHPAADPEEKLLDQVSRLTVELFNQ